MLPAVAPPIRLSSAAGRDENSPAWLIVRRGRTHWRVAAELADELLGPAEPPLRRWMAEGAAVPVKSGPHRDVYRIELPAGVFYLKHYKSSGLLSRVQHLLRPCRAVREYRAARRVAAAGVDTVSPVAVGWTVRGASAGESFLIVREISGTTTLHEAVLRATGAEYDDPEFRRDACGFLQIASADRQRLAAELGRLVGRLHAHGLVHRDLHAGNILVRIDEDRLRLWLIDLHAVSARRAVSLRRAERNLALLNNLLWHYTTRSDRRRFFRTYRDERHSGPAGRRKAAGDVRRVEARCHRLERTYRAADRKWRRGNRRLIIADAPPARCRGLAWLGRRRLEEIRDGFAGEIAGPSLPVGRIFKSVQSVELSRYSALRSVRGIANPSDENIALSTQEVLNSPVRLDLPGNRIDALLTVVETPHRRRLLPGPAGWSITRRAWEWGHALLRRRIGVTRPLFFVECDDGGHLRQCLATELPPGAVPLSQFAEPICDDLVRRAAGQFRRLHESGFDVALSTPDGLLVGEGRTGGQIWFADLTDVRRRRMTQRRAARRLAELADIVPHESSLRRTQRLRFLRAYLGPRFAGRWKRLWRMIEKRTAPVGSRPGRAARALAGAALALATALAGGCLAGPGAQTFAAQEPVERPVRHSVRAEQLLVFSDFRLPREHPLIAELLALRHQVAETLELPLETEEEVVVYIFDNQLEYRQYLGAVYPSLPDRRAYFVGTPKELAVYTFWGDRIQEDLRHEYTHGLLHAALSDVPLWLDEGLAEYFEVPGPRPGTINIDYAGRLAAMLANAWRPDLGRLERLRFSQMQHVDYQESWAWVHFLLHSSPETRRILLDYLADLSGGRATGPLSQRLKRALPGCEARFVNYLASLQMHRLVTGAASPPPGAWYDGPVNPSGKP